MRRFLSLLILCAASMMPAVSLYAAENLEADHVKISIVAPSRFSGEGDAIGIRFDIDPHWHIYWKNPGDSGTAPKFKMESEQADFDTPSWPVPKRFRIGELTNIGYEASVTFPVTVHSRIKDGPMVATVDLEWLVCQEECIPGFGSLQFSRPVSSEARTQDDTLLLKTLMQNLPGPEKTSPWILDKVESQGQDVLLYLRDSAGSPLSSLAIFPGDGNIFVPAEPLISADGKAIQLRLASGKKAPRSVNFLLVDSRGGAWEFAPGENLVHAQSGNGGWSTYLILLLSAFAGGILLNLMPCVLPVLSIKFFSLAKVNTRTRWREAMLYTFGVLVTFTLLGAVFLGLRAGGAAIGWGFQLQSPAIVTALITLFWLMGLSFIGFFEFGNSLTRAAGKFENTGSFATGCLSVFIATPCTGPFMGTALGAAAVMPTAEALLIFFFLGLGLASPFILLACFPKIRLPRPGIWMVTLRQFLAFPLFATVVWLLWVLGMQLGTDSWVYISSLGLILAFCIWLGKGRSVWFKSLAVVLALAAFVGTEKWVISAPLASASAAEKSSDSRWVDYDAKLIEEARGKGQAVFVDFTAAWCVTCQVNKKAVLETEAAESLFAENHVKLVRGDWTNLDAKIADALSVFGRASVPLYLFYPADGSRPQILPQILSLSDIERLFPKP